MPVEPAKSAITRDPILVDLALQGGGSHGAFTWGVLDRLLEEPWLGIDGISGTSAGAMNAAVLVDGHAKGGAAGARMALENFWRRVSEAARFSPFRRGPLDVLLGRWTLDSSPIYVTIDLMSRLLSPYDLNPMGNNPLRAILAEAIDFARLAQAPIKIFITATNVRSGRGHVLPTGGAGCVASSPLMRPLRPLRLCPCMFFLCVCVCWSRRVASAIASDPLAGAARRGWLRAGLARCCVLPVPDEPLRCWPPFRTSAVDAWTSSMVCPVAFDEMRAPSRCRSKSPETSINSRRAVYASLAFPSRLRFGRPGTCGAANGASQPNRRQRLSPRTGTGERLVPLDGSRRWRVSNVSSLAFCVDGCQHRRQVALMSVRPALANVSQPTSRTSKLGRYRLCLGMRVSHQHPGVSVSANGSNFRHIETLLEEPAYCFVAQVVEPQARDAGSSSQALPSEPQRVGRDNQHSVPHTRSGPDHFEGSWRERHGSRMTVLRVPQEDRAGLKVHIVPQHGQQLATPHPRLYGQLDRRRQPMALAFASREEPLQFSRARPPLSWVAGRGQLDLIDRVRWQHETPIRSARPEGNGERQPTHAGQWHP
jgi:hypothetical protein